MRPTLPPRRLLLLCLLFQSPVFAASLIWDGGGDGVSWNDASNWSTDSVPTTADTVSFNSGGTTTISDAIAPGFQSMEIAAGRVVLRNLANTTAGGPITVQAGATLAAAASGAASALGTSPVTLNGGTLEYLPGAPTVLNGLKEQWYTTAVDLDFADTLLDPMTLSNPLSLLSRTANVTKFLDAALSFPSDALINTRSNNLGQDRIAALWSGKLTVGAAGSGAAIEEGTVTFGTSSDDGSVVWIDLDQNGVFDTPRERVVNNLGLHGILNRVGTTNLVAGSYGIAIAFYERGGGAGIEARFAPGAVAEANYATMTVINPTLPAQNLVFTRETVPPGTPGTAITVAADSTVRLASTLPRVAAGALSFSGPHQLTLESPDTFQELSFTSANLSGSARFRQTGRGRITLGAVGETAASGLAQHGDGTLVLTAANTYSGLTSVTNGVLEVQANNGLGGTANGTVVSGTGSLRLGAAVVYTAVEPLSLAGAGHVLSDAALNTVSGTTDFYGPITLSAAAKIRSAAGNLRLFGQVNINGMDLELRTDANIEFQTGGIVGDGAITQRGFATAIHFQNADANTNFDADLRIYDGTWDARGVNSLGTTNGATVVENNGRLLVRDGKTWAEAITLNGNDGLTGALRSENNLNVLTGPITLATDSMIWVNDVQLTVSGPITGGRLLQKGGTGTLILRRDNAVSSVDLLGGEIRIHTAGGLGTTAQLRIDGNEALEMADGVDLMAGGSLTNLVVANGAILCVNGDCTLDVPVQIGALASFQLGGNGNLNVPRSLGNGANPLPSQALNHFGFHSGPETALDLNNNGGLMNGGNPTGLATFYAMSLLTDGPLGRGLDFNDDNDFITSGAIGQVDNFSNLWLGMLNVQAGQAGAWTLRNAGDDDRGGIWLDLDQDGVFESTTAGLGSNRGEQLSWEDGGTKTVTLAEGSYLVAFTQHEFGGGSGLDIRFKGPHMGAEAVVKPSDPAQVGTWSTFGSLTPRNTLRKVGTGTLTLQAANSHNGGTTVTEGTLVAAHNQALGLATNTVSVLQGASLALSGGRSVNVATLSLEGSGAPGRSGALTFFDGDNTIQAGSLVFPDSIQNQVAVGGDAGRLTVQAPSVDLRLARLVFKGAGDVDFQPSIHSALSGAQAVNQVMAYLYNGNATVVPGTATAVATKPLATAAYFPNEIDYLNFWGDRLRGLNNAANPGDPNNFGVSVRGDLTIAGSGPVDVVFRTTAADDANRIRIDLDRDGLFETGLEDPFGADRTGNYTTTNLITVTRGLAYPVVLQAREGGGASRLQPEISLDNGTTWQRFTPGGMSGATFNTTVPATAGLVKRGAGRLTLSGANTFTGAATVEDGVLVVTRPESLGGASGVTEVTGGTVALQGPLTLSGETFRLRGGGATNQVGALVNLGGTTVLDATVIVGARTNAPAMTIGAEAGTLVIQSGVDLDHAALTVDGAGAVEINGPIHGLGAGASSPAVPFAGPFTFAQVGAPTFNLEGWTVTNGFAGSHDRGGGNIALTAGRSAGDYAWDNPHPTCLITSPPFLLDGSGNPLTFLLYGGDSNGRALPTNVSQILSVANSANATGVQGVGLRRVDTGDYVLTKAAPNDNFNGTLSFTPAELASVDPDAIYVFDFFDTYDGGWGWVDLDDVSIPGNQVVDIPVDNRLVKRGSGTLRLNGANTYDAGTTVEAGLLLANHAANSTGPESVLVGDGAVLGGTGTIAGQILVGARGVVAPGASTGILSSGSEVLFSNFASVFRAELNGAAAAGASYDQLQVAQGLALSGATLELVRDPGYVPAAGQVLTLATAGAGVSGTFNDLPEGARVSAQGREFIISYAGGAVTLTASGGLRVYAGPDTVYRVPTSGVVMAATTLLANDLIGDGAGPLLITSVLGTSQAGGVVSLASGQITYTPPLDYTGADSFTYTVSDGTDTATGLVTILPATGIIGERPASNPAGLMALPNGDYRVSFTGTPGVPYDIEWTLDIATLPVVWQTLGTVVADGSGNITLDHANPPASLIYYRAVLR